MSRIHSGQALLDPDFRQRLEWMDDLCKALESIKAEHPLQVNLIPGVGLTLSFQPGRKGAGLTALPLVALAQDGGSIGTTTTATSWTYTVTDLLTGAVLGTALSPETARPARGPLLAATRGLGYYNNSGAFVLMHAFEVPDVEVCTP